RTYRNLRWTEFAVEGEVELDSLILPGEDGFSQQRAVFDRSNVFNAVISESAKLLSIAVSDPHLRDQLTRMRGVLGHQPRIGDVDLLPRRVPSRHRAWQDPYDLSRLVLQGFGADLA